MLLKDNHYYNAKQLLVHDAFQKYFSLKNILNFFFILTHYNYKKILI
jgi:hypothetical protein